MKKKEEATHELLGEEYACDGEWVLVVIMTGTKKSCNEAKRNLTGESQYRFMRLFKLEDAE